MILVGRELQLELLAEPAQLLPPMKSAPPDPRLESRITSLEKCKINYLCKKHQFTKFIGRRFQFHRCSLKYAALQLESVVTTYITIRIYYIHIHIYIYNVCTYVCTHTRHIYICMCTINISYTYRYVYIYIYIQVIHITWS